MIKRGLVTLVLLVVNSIGAGLIIPDTALAAPSVCDKEGMILTLKPWYYGLTDDQCVIKTPDQAGGLQQFIIRIALNIVEDLLNIVAFTAAGFIIYGGFVFLTSGGSPDRATAGRKTVTNAVIGIVIAMASILLVNFVGGAIGI